MIKVLLCDQRNVTALLLLIHEMLNGEPDIDAHNHCVLPDMPKLADEIEPDVAIFIAGYPGADDRAAIRKQRELHPDAKLIALSLGGSIPGYVEPLKEAGVDLVIPAEGALQLPAQIRAVMKTPQAE